MKELTFQGLMDNLKSKVTSEPKKTLGVNLSKTLFYFDEHILYDPESYFQVTIHERKNGKEAMVSIPLGENILEAFNSETVFHLYDKRGKLVSRMTARELALKYEQLAKK